MADAEIYQELEYEFRRLVAQMRVDDDFLSAVGPAEVAFTMYGTWAGSAAKILLSWDLAVREMVAYRWPADWWEAVKERFAPRWFLARWPMRYRSVTLSEIAPLTRYPGEARYSVRHVYLHEGAQDE